LLKIISPNVPIFLTSLLPVIALESSISTKASDLLTLSIIVGIIYENLLCSALLKHVYIYVVSLLTLSLALILCLFRQLSVMNWNAV
jgi:hypothetical protein